MFNIENRIRSESIISDSISLPNKSAKTPMEILNLLIKELRAARLDIQSVSFFENPPEAIVRIKKPNRPRSKWSWVNAFRLTKKDEASMLFLKLQVQQDLPPQTPCHLQYEIQPGLA